jgi:hypothetical protein
LDDFDVLKPPHRLQPPNTMVSTTRRQITWKTILKIWKILKET